MKCPHCGQRIKKPKTGDLFAAPDPRHAPMVAALTAIYAEETRGSRYAFGGRDAKAVQHLLRLTADDDEVHFKWRTALRASFDQFHTPKTRTIPELVRDWNAYTAVKAGAA